MNYTLGNAVTSGFTGTEEHDGLSSVYQTMWKELTPSDQTCQVIIIVSSIQYILHIQNKSIAHCT